MPNIFRTSPRFVDGGLLIIRIIVGISFLLAHGIGKLTGGPERWERTGNAMANIGIEFFPFFWGFMAAFAETFGGVLLILGLVFRPAAFLLLCTMIVAASRHIINGDSLSRIFHPIELGAVVLALMIIGAGKYSLDRIVFKK